MNTLLLAENGRPKATIVIGKHPTPAVALAARELQYHIQKISGAVPAVVTANTAAMEEARKLGPLILIGESEAAREAVGAIRFEPQEYLVELANSLEPAVDTIVLWGEDAGLRDFEYTTVHSRVASMSEEFGNACHFTENNRPIMVTGIDMDPDCGSLEAWVRPRIDPGSTGATILRIPFLPTVRHILELKYVNDHVIVRYELHDNKTFFLYLWSDNLLAQGWHNQWHHILVTYEKKADASSLELKLFVDGVKTKENVCKHWNLGFQGGDVYIGGYTEGTDPTSRADFRGEIDEVRISRGVRNPPNLNVPVTISPYTADPDTMLLLHFDEADGTVSFINNASNQSMIYEHRFPIPNIWENHGSLNAVYDFLERSCGVRWYAPGEIGEVYDKNSTLEVDVKVVRRKPAMMHRDIHTPNMTGGDRGSDWYMVGPWKKPETLIPNKDRNLWLLRMRMGGTPRHAGHSLPGRCANYLDLYPEWFAHDGSTILMLDDGHGKPVPSKLCYKHDPLNNPLDDPSSEVLDERIIVALCKDARNYFEGKEAILGNNHLKDCYSLVPTDKRGWCKCQECLKRRFPRKEVEGCWSNDALSYSIHNFTRRIAREFRQKYPTWVGQKWFCQYAYASYAHYPKWTQGSLPQEDLDDIDESEIVNIEGTTLETFASIEPNVFTWLCLQTRTLWNEGVQKNDADILDDWRKHEQTGKRLGVYLYYGKPFSDVALMTNPFNCFPAFCPSQIVSLYTQTKDDSEVYIGFKGMAGVHVEMSAWTASFLVDQLELYLTFKLADDPELPGKELIDEFFRRYYGPAAEAMRSLYNGVEQALTTPPEQLPAGLNEAQMWGGKGLGNPSRMARCLKHIADAVAAAVEPNEAGTSPTFGMPQTPPVVQVIAGTGLSAQSVPRSTEHSTICKDRVDLFRRGVWDYMVEGYKNYWTNPQPADAIAAGSALPILKLRMRWHVTELQATLSGGLPARLPGDLAQPFSCDELRVVIEWSSKLRLMWDEYYIDTNRVVIAVVRKGPALRLAPFEILLVAGDHYVRSIADRICEWFRMHSIEADVIEVVSSQPLLDELLRLGIVDTDRKSVPMVAEIEWSD